MTERHTGASVNKDVILPPPPEDLLPSNERGRSSRAERSERPATETATLDTTAQGRPIRRARLRLVQVEPWSVMKTAFLLSVAVGIVTVVAVGIVWGVLGAAGLWDSVNSIVQDSIGDNSGDPFEIETYLGTSRVL